MRTGLTIVAVIAIALAGIAAYYLVDIDMTQQARLPDVDINVEGGQLPELDVDTGSVEIGEREVDVTVPEVSVEMTEETVTVPTIELNQPAD